MNRRRFLATVAATGAVTAGCLGDGDAGGGNGDGNGGAGNGGADGPGTGTPTPADAGSGGNGTDAPTDDAGDAVRVESLTLQHGLVVPETPDSITVGHEDHRYLWVRLTVGEDPPDREAFALSTGAETYDPLGPDEHRPYRTTWGDDAYYDGSRGTHLLLFELPLTVDTDRLRFETPAGHVAATAAEIGRLGRSPTDLSVSLEKRYAETPDEPVAVAVRNESDVPGRFLGAINRQGPRIAYTPVARVAVPLAAGEERTVPVADPMTHRTATPGDGAPEMTYTLRTLHGDDRAAFGE